MLWTNNGIVRVEDVFMPGEPCEWLLQWRKYPGPKTGRWSWI